MNDVEWFKFYQPSLLGLVNTKDGRDLFDISHDLPTIVELAPWYHKCLIGGDVYQSEFHSRAVFFRRLLHRWNEIIRDLEHPLFVPRYVLHKGKRVPVPMGAATLTAYPDAHTESATVDGYCGFQGLDPDDRVNWSSATTDDGSGGNIVGFDYSSSRNILAHQKTRIRSRGKIRIPKPTAIVQFPQRTYAPQLYR